MGERHQGPQNSDTIGELFEPGFGDFSEDITQDLEPASTEQQRLVRMRRQAERRLEETRLRDELGDYDLEFEER